MLLTHIDLLYLIDFWFGWLFFLRLLLFALVCELISVCTESPSCIQIRDFG